MKPVFGPICAMVALTATFAFAADVIYPLDATVSGDAIYVADRGEGTQAATVFKIAGSKITTYFEASRKFRTPLNALRCITTDADGKLVAGDSSTRDIYRFGDDGKPVALTNGGIGIPMDIVDDGKGNLYVTDLELHRLYRVPKAGGKPELVAKIPAPRGLTIDQEGNLIVVSHGKDHLLRVSPKGEVSVVVKGRKFKFANDVVVGKDGTIYVSDGYSRAIWKIDGAGKAERWATGDPLINPVGLSWRGEDLIVVDSRTKKGDPKAPSVFVVTPDAKISPLEYAE